MATHIPVSREQLAQIPYLDLKNWDPQRQIHSLTFYVKGEWRMWFPGNGQLNEIVAMPVEADYFGDSPARATDQVYRLLNFTAQYASFPELYRAARGIWNDFQDLGTSLAKISLFHKCRRELDGNGSRFVQTEIEYIVSVCRGIYDLLQEIIRSLWDRTTFVDRTVKKKGLPKSFADVVLHSNTPLTQEEIIAKRGMPAALAKWYVSQTNMFGLIRDLRNRMIHGGSRSTSALFNCERGFAIFRYEKPWCELYRWPAAVEEPNQLVPIRPVLCEIISRTIDATNTFADLIEQTIQFPPPLVPGFTYFSRGYSDRKLCEMKQVVEGSWWCDTNSDSP